jgi:hypothetical protein
LVQLTAGTWQHVAVVCDGEKAFCYINGEEKSLGSSIGKFAPNPNLTFRLGQGYGEKRFFRGLLRRADLPHGAVASGGAEGDEGVNGRRIWKHRN